MGLLDADAAGLRELAQSLRGHALEILNPNVPAPQGLSCQATAAAVSSANADVISASGRLADRLRQTAARIDLSSTQYVTNEEESAAKLDALIFET